MGSAGNQAGGIKSWPRGKISGQPSTFVINMRDCLSKRQRSKRQGTSGSPARMSAYPKPAAAGYSPPQPRPSLPAITTLLRRR